jgi:hypothetical protein
MANDIKIDPKTGAPIVTPVISPTTGNIQPDIKKGDSPLDVPKKLGIDSSVKDKVDPNAPKVQPGYPVLSTLDEGKGKPLPSNLANVAVAAAHPVTPIPPVPSDKSAVDNTIDPKLSESVNKPFTVLGERIQDANIPSTKEHDELVRTHNLLHEEHINLSNKHQKLSTESTKLQDEVKQLKARRVQPTLQQMELINEALRMTSMDSQQRAKTIESITKILSE